MRKYPRRSEVYNGIEIQPFTEIEPERLELCARAAYQLTHYDDTRAILHERHMPGVILRHGKTSTSRDAFKDVKEQMENGRLKAFMIYQGDHWAGVGTIMPDLPLREPANALGNLLPAGVTRRSDFLSRPVVTDGPNISAWLAAEDYRDDTLGSAYSLMQEFLEEGQNAWTLEPIRSHIGSQAMKAAGMMLAGGPKRYDDFEALGESRPPVSNLYQMRLEP